MWSLYRSDYSIALHETLVFIRTMVFNKKKDSQRHWWFLFRVKKFDQHHRKVTTLKLITVTQTHHSEMKENLRICSIVLHLNNNVYYNLMGLYEALNWLDYRVGSNNSFSSKHFLEDKKHPAHLNPWFELKVWHFASLSQCHISFSIWIKINFNLYFFGIL